MRIRLKMNIRMTVNDKIQAGFNTRNEPRWQKWPGVKQVEVAYR
jgi:hypothetical protein